jgi:hypothetical protein
MKRLFAAIFAPLEIAMEILKDESIITELRNDNDNYAVGWNERMITFREHKGTILIAFVPAEEMASIPMFFKRVAGNPLCFVFTETPVYGKLISKARTPNGKETFAVISPGEFTAGRIIETIQFMREEFP